MRYLQFQLTPKHLDIPEKLRVIKNLLTNEYSTLKQQLLSFTTWITLVHAYTLPSSDILKHLADKVED